MKGELSRHYFSYLVRRAAATHGPRPLIANIIGFYSGPGFLIWCALTGVPWDGHLYGACSWRHDSPSRPAIFFIGSLYPTFLSRDLLQRRDPERNSIGSFPIPSPSSFCLRCLHLSQKHGYWNNSVTLRIRCSAIFFELLEDLVAAALRLEREF